MRDRWKLHFQQEAQLLLTVRAMLEQASCGVSANTLASVCHPLSVLAVLHQFMELVVGGVA